MNSFLTAIILAAGSGSRMKHDITKQRIVIGNESVLHRTVKAFDKCKAVNSIIVVVREDEVDFARQELSDINKLETITVGGKTRLESARAGFLSIDEKTDFVAIHDAARCFVTDEIINSVLADAKKYGAATASSPMTDTVKMVDASSNIVKTVDRSALVLVQTPQIFRADLYNRALEGIDVSDASVTDDNMLMERVGICVHCTDTGKNNIKLTVAEDLKYAEFLLNGE